MLFLVFKVRGNCHFLLILSIKWTHTHTSASENPIYYLSTFRWSDHWRWRRMESRPETGRSRRKAAESRSRAAATRSGWSSNRPLRWSSPLPTSTLLMALLHLVISIPCKTLSPSLQPLSSSYPYYICRQEEDIITICKSSYYQEMMIFENYYDEILVTNTIGLHSFLYPGFGVGVQSIFSSSFSVKYVGISQIRQGLTFSCNISVHSLQIRVLSSLFWRL